MSSPLAVTRTSVRDGYRLWSRTYDAQLNPFLSLERRVEEALLPDLEGLDVADIGCGTGRWLEHCAGLSRRTLVGVDSSAEMIERATEKLGDRARLVVADCCSLPLELNSVDFVLCSFLVSYLDDLDRFATELFRVCRTGASVLVSDLHPVTCAENKWRRSFKSGQTEYELTTRTWEIDALLAAFRRVGFRTEGVIEPRFGKEEIEIFRAAGKLHVLKAASQSPALLVLQLRAGSSRRPGQMAFPQLRKVSGGRVALNAEDACATDIHIDEAGRVDFLGDTRWCPRSGDLPAPDSAVDLTGHLVLPGLVNAHDHLEFALFPRLGSGPYSNYLQWADHIHQPQSSPVREHRAVPKDVRLWWGGIRNLLSGVTTVCHHNPFAPDVFTEGFPVTVLRDFEWAHSLALGGPSAPDAEQRSSDKPFIIHVAEGVDDQSASELAQLDKVRRLNAHAVVVHGLAVGARGRKLLNARGASLVWCPTSNFFLFGRTHTAAEIAELKNVALGSDSSLTAAGDLLDEIKCARYTVGATAIALYAQVTTGAARVLRMKDGQGKLIPGSVADFIAVQDKLQNPADTLVNLSYRNVELVVRRGVVQLASRAMLERLPEQLRAGLAPLEVEGTVRWIRAPLGRLFAKAINKVGCPLRLGGRRLRHVASAWL